MKEDTTALKKKIDALQRENIVLHNEMIESERSLIVVVGILLFTIAILLMV